MQIAFQILRFYTESSPSVTQRLFSGEKCFKKILVALLHKVVSSSNSLNLKEKKQVFRKARLEFKVVHYGLWKTHPDGTP